MNYIWIILWSLCGAVSLFILLIRMGVWKKLIIFLTAVLIGPEVLEQEMTAMENGLASNLAGGDHHKRLVPWANKPASSADSGNQKLPGTQPADATVAQPVEQPVPDICTDIIQLVHPEIGATSFGELKMLGFLGGGAFGSIMRVAITSHGNQESAMKSVMHECDKSVMLNEIQVYGNLPRHRNIMSFIGFSNSPEYPLLFLEICDENLGQFLGKMTPLLTPEVRIKLTSISLQITDGMMHLHANGIVHGQLMLHHIMVTNGRNVKIGDLALCKNQWSNFKNPDKSRLAWKHLSPECLSRDLKIRGPANDFWSFGCLLWEIWNFGLKPYFPECRSPAELQQCYFGGIRAALDQIWPLEIVQCIAGSWEGVSERRMNFSTTNEIMDKLLMKLADYVEIV